MQAYWNVATKRLVDNVCMTMEQDFVVKLLGKVESELFLLTNRYTEVEELFVEVRWQFARLIITDRYLVGPVEP